MRLDDPGVDDVQCAKVLERAGPADGVVVPVALGDQRARSADRRRAESRDPLRGLVDHRADRVDLRVQHGVHGDEVRPGHVPVHVLEGQGQVIEGVEPILQQLDYPLGAVGLESRHGIGDHVCPLPVR